MTLEDDYGIFVMKAIHRGWVDINQKKLFIAYCLERAHKEGIKGDDVDVIDSLWNRYYNYYDIYSDSTDINEQAPSIVCIVGGMLVNDFKIWLKTIYNKDSELDICAL